MGAFPITAYDRPGIAAANLLQGDMRGAALGLVSPETLSPTKITPLHRRIIDQLGGIAKTNPFLRGVMSVATDPLVIMMLFLSSRYPVVGAQRLFDMGRKYAGFGYKPGLFAGLFARAERLFANTGIPELMAKTTAETEKFGTGWGGMVGKWLSEFKKSVGRYPTAQEHLVLGAKLSRLDQPGAVVSGALLKNKIQLTPAMQRLYDHMDQEFFPQFHKNVVLPLKGSKAYGRALVRAAERAGIDPGVLMAASEKNKATVGYFPRTLMRTPELSYEYAQQLIEATGGDPEIARQISKAAAVSKMSGHALPRRGGLIPSKEELAAVGELNPAAWAELEKQTKGRASGMFKQISPTVEATMEYVQGGGNVDDAMKEIKAMLRSAQLMPTRYRQQMADLMQAFRSGDIRSANKAIFDMAASGAAERKFSIAMGPVVNNYIHSFSRPFVWSVLPAGEGIGIPKGAAIGEALVSLTNRLNPRLKHMMTTDYLPILQGMTTESQTQGMLRWADLKLRALDSLEVGKVGKLLPETWRKKLTDMLVGERGGLSYLNAQAKVAGYFYYSALGFNPASAFQNLLQPIITTMPMVGPKAFWQGLSATTRKVGNYYGLRQRGIEPTDAFMRAFPEFSKAGLAPEPLSQSILRDALEGTWSQAQGMPIEGFKPGTKPWLQELKRLSMSMFSGSERFNRLVSFEAGLAKARLDGIYTGMPNEKALDFAAAVVRATQFPAGPGQMPRLLLKLPAPWRQFMYFPIRYAGFLAESTMYGGQDKRNWGTIARTVMYSTMAHRLLSEVAGVDVSRSLMMGALPGPGYEKAPFFPFPAMPPIAGLAGAGLMAAAQGSTEPLRQVSGLLMPGGISLRRAYRTLHPKYADYGNRGPDGKIPVYGDDKALIGYTSPLGLLLKASGIRPSSAAAESETVRYLLKHRDTIREFRRRYVEATVSGNQEDAQRIQDQFRRAYPELGGIQLKPSDLKAAEDRHTLTRLQRMVRTFPTEYRGEFQNVVNTAMGNYTVGAFGPAGSEPPPLDFQFDYGPAFR